MCDQTLLRLCGRPLATAWAGGKTGRVVVVSLPSPAARLLAGLLAHGAHPRRARHERHVPVGPVERVDGVRRLGGPAARRETSESKRSTQGPRSMQPQNNRSGSRRVACAYTAPLRHALDPPEALVVLRVRFGEAPEGHKRHHVPADLKLLPLELGHLDCARNAGENRPVSGRVTRARSDARLKRSQLSEAAVKLCA